MGWLHSGLGHFGPDTVNAMNIDQLLSALQAERSRISIAIEALSQLDSSVPAKRRGRWYSFVANIDGQRPKSRGARSTPLPQRIWAASPCTPCPLSYKSAPSPVEHSLGPGPQRESVTSRLALTTLLEFAVRIFPPVTLVAVRELP